MKIDTWWESGPTNTQDLVETNLEEGTQTITEYSIKDWWAHGRPDITETHWDTWEKEHRFTLPLAVDATETTSLFEIGCGAGPNLRLLSQKCTNVRLGGSDVSTREIEFIRERLTGDFSVQTMPHRVNSTWGAVLSCYAMAYVAPPLVRRQLRLIESRWLILIEPWGDGQLELGNAPDVSPKWRHDWASQTRATGWTLSYRWPIAHVDYLSVLAIYEK